MFRCARDSPPSHSQLQVIARYKTEHNFLAEFATLCLVM